MHNTEAKLSLCEINNKRISFCPLKAAIKEDHGYFEEITDMQEILEVLN